MRIAFDALGLSFDAEVIEWSAGYAEKLSGPPEDCYPGEAAYLEIDDLQVLEIITGNWLPCSWLLNSDVCEEIVQYATDAMIAREERCAE
jgi:hypothetical protein